MRDLVDKFTPRERGRFGESSGGNDREARKSDLCEFKVRLAQRSEKAWRCEDGAGKSDWFPKSQCELHDDPNSSWMTLVCPEWLAKEKGWL